MSLINIKPFLLFIIILINFGDLGDRLDVNNNDDIPPPLRAEFMAGRVISSFLGNDMYFLFPEYFWN